MPGCMCVHNNWWQSGYGSDSHLSVASHPTAPVGERGSTDPTGKGPVLLRHVKRKSEARKKKQLAIGNKNTNDFQTPYMITGILWWELLAIKYK